MQSALIATLLMPACQPAKPGWSADSWPALLLFYLAPWTLLVDSISGALQQTPAALPWSLLYKVVLLTLLVWQLCLWRDKQLLWLTGLLVLGLGGPAYSYMTVTALSDATVADFVATEVALLLKALAPLLAFCFFRQFCRRYPLALLLLTDRLMLLSYGVILLNLALGLLGYGYTAYQPMDNVAQPFLGVKGYFYSTNELAVVLLVVSGWLLWRCWPAQKACYLLLSLATIGSAALLLTKTGLLGSMLLVMLIPLLAASKRDYRRYARPLSVALLLAFCCLLLFIWYAEPLLRAAGLYDKLAYAYQQRGVAGIVLSSRDLYLAVIWQETERHYPDVHRLFGVGVAGVSVLLKKYFIEIDLFDLLVFYGLAGGLIFGLTFGRFFYSCYSQIDRHRLAATVLCVNLLLFGVAMLAGHVLTSGMLWLPWALLNAMVFNRYLLSSAADHTSDMARGPDERSA
ncbi:O-antigen ligase family protein [Arsukibacterium sp.]|uniref:O-antigen ligase family protein n=1 Tax=Arsukibacterium sp. TaxID=1977258 RepID=UPI00299E6883|nr:O-antigen ligase family protein [Arsukibacterium sp.]MDX1677602.1 O-antigen ligase family protein [Arsukibacterium sp.]